MTRTQDDKEENTEEEEEEDIFVEIRHAIQVILKFKQDEVF